jgi:hypothetical protein
MDINTRYRQVVAGEFSKADFLKEAKEDSRLNRTFSHLNSYEEVVSIFKNRGFITETVNKNEEKEFNFMSILKESISDLDKPDDFAHQVQQVNPFEYEKGWRYEAKGKDLSDDKVILAAQKKAIANLKKDAIYYTKIEMGKHAPTDKEVESKKMIDISKGENYKDKNHQVKPVKMAKPEDTKEDSDRVKIEKLKTKLLEDFKKKNLADNQLNEGAWSKLKALSASLHKYKPKSKERKALEDKLNSISDQAVNDELDKLESALNKIDPKFPNGESIEKFNQGCEFIYDTYYSIKHAATLDPSEQGYMDPILANKLIDGIKLYVKTLKDSELASTYKAFNESLNENVAVTAADGFTQILQKMTGISLNQNQSVDNLKSAIEKVGGGNYEKGLEVTKKLFTNNGAGSVDQQADKLTDLIAHGGKIGDAFTKSSGTFGNKGLFSVKLPPATTEKIANAVAKLAGNAATHVTQHSDTIKQAAHAIKHVVHHSAGQNAAAVAALLSSLGVAYFVAKQGFKFAKNNDSRYATLNDFYNLMKPSPETEEDSVSDEPKRDQEDNEEGGSTEPTTDNTSQVDTDVTGTEGGEEKNPEENPEEKPEEEEKSPVDVPFTINNPTEFKELPLKDKLEFVRTQAPKATDGMSDLEISKLADKRAKELLNRFNSSNTSKPIELSPKDTSKDFSELTLMQKLELGRKGVTERSWDELNSKEKLELARKGTPRVKSTEPVNTKNEPETNTKTGKKLTQAAGEEGGKGVKAKTEKKKDSETPVKKSGEQVAAKQGELNFTGGEKEELIPYGKPARYVSSTMKSLAKPVESITLPEEKNEEGNLIRNKIIIKVDPAVKLAYNKEIKKKDSLLASTINKLKDTAKANVKAFPVIINLENEGSIDNLVKKLKKIKITKGLKEQFVVEILKQRLLEDLYTPSLGMFVPYPQGRLVDKDDLERELRNNTPADNQNYTDHTSVYTNRIDSERLVKIDQLIRQMGQPGIDLYNKYAEALGCAPYDVRAQIFNPVQVPDDKSTYIDGDGNVEPVRTKTKDVFESEKPSFTPNQQNILETLNDIYKRCVPKTGIEPFTEYLQNTEFDPGKKEHKLAAAFVKYKLSQPNCQHKEELQQALEDLKAKYRI